jgi:hypothetical protein
MPIRVNHQLRYKDFIRAKETFMKGFYLVGACAILAGVLSMVSVDAAQKSKKKTSKSGNATATGGNGGNATGAGAKGGNGGSATAQGGTISDGTSTSSGNATATGGNGGNASGKGAKGGNGGGAVAVSGNGNTIVNGNGNTIIGKVVNNNITFRLGGGGVSGVGGAGGGNVGSFGSGFVTPSGAFAQAGAGGDGTSGNAGTGTPSGDSETAISTNGAPAVAKGQNGKDNVGEGEKEEVFTSRFLKVKNETGEPLKVFVQFRGKTDTKWAWTPADPSDSKDALTYNLKPGQEMFLKHKGQKIAASRVRVWGISDNAKVLDYRDQDLWVVPEMDDRGEHCYLATEMKTFTFIFPRAGK